MALTRVRRAILSRCPAGALLLAGSALWEPADAQYGGFGFPFFGNPWFGQPAPPRWAPRQRDLPRHRQPRERESREREPTTPPSPHKPDVAPAKTGIVIGDSMAEWLAYGLEQAYAESADIGVVSKVRQSTGLIDQCKGELRKWVEQSLANEKPVFVAIMIGINDRHSMQACGPPGKSDGVKSATYPFRSKEWAEAYATEVHEAISLLKSKGVPVFWVGLPPAKNIRDVDMGFLNDVFRERAEKDGIGYIDVWDAFVDEEGDFSMRGPDVNGQTRLLRPAAAEPPVAARETNNPPVKPNERPIAGPVVPLTEAPPVKGDALLGAASTAPADARLLGGEPAAPARGRADDFSWPRAQEAPAVVQEGPGYAQEGSGGVPRSSKPSARDSSRKSGENAH